MRADPNRRAKYPASLSKAVRAGCPILSAAKGGITIFGHAAEAEKLSYTDRNSVKRALYSAPEDRSGAVTVITHFGGPRVVKIK
jgi:hypothetical protein